MKLSNMSIETAIQNIANHMTEAVEPLLEDRKTWNKQAGQVIVYGYETVVGFNHAANLCAAVEQAFKKKTDINTAIVAYLTKSHAKKA